MFTVEPLIEFPIFQPFSANLSDAMEADNEFSMNMNAYIRNINVTTQVYSDKASATLGHSNDIINSSMHEMEMELKET